MTYGELLEIYNKNINITTDTLPSNAFFLASYLNLRVENSIQCKKYYESNGEISPLINCNACLCLLDGEYIIYHDEKYPYKNFAIAHELSHYLLGDATDGITQHHNANLLAAIIIAPPHLLNKSKITSATELSLQCKIPIETATEYWNEYCKHHLNKNIKRIINLKSILTIVLCITFISISLNFLLINTIIKDAKNNEYITSTKEQDTELENLPKLSAYQSSINNGVIGSNQNTSSNDVYVTKNGKKFHLPTCQYIIHADTTLKFTYDEAINLGYEPCKVCFD